MFFLITVTFGILLGNTLSSSGHSDPGTIASIDIFLGALLVLLGLRNMFDRKNENQSGILLKYLKIKKAASAFSKFIHYFIVGFLTFLINFSTAIFVLAAARQIGLDNAGSMTKSLLLLFSV